MTVPTIKTRQAPALSQAPVEVQLAVDLILLLEQHELPTELVLKALKLVQRDFTAKALREKEL